MLGVTLGRCYAISDMVGVTLESSLSTVIHRYPRTFITTLVNHCNPHTFTAPLLTHSKPQTFIPSMVTHGNPRMEVTGSNW